MFIRHIVMEFEVSLSICLGSVYTDTVPLTILHILTSDHTLFKGYYGTETC
jgi:hypothetical protein